MVLEFNFAGELPATKSTGTWLLVLLSVVVVEKLGCLENLVTRSAEEGEGHDDAADVREEARRRDLPRGGDGGSGAED